MANSLNEKFEDFVSENVDAETVTEMKNDNSLFKKACPKPIMKRIKETYMYSSGYLTDDSDSSLLEKKSERGNISLSEL